MQLFDYSSDEKVREFTCASFNPSGETVVVGSFNRYYIFSYNITRQQWEEAGVKVRNARHLRAWIELTGQPIHERSALWAGMLGQVSGLHFHCRASANESGGHRYQATPKAVL